VGTGAAILIVLAVIVGLALIVGVWGMVTYNGLIALRNRVQEAWRQIDVELTRRHDLIPNLVETVKGYAGHERETLEAVVQARAAAVSPGASVAQQGEQEGLLTAALGRLFALAEAYPDLKANQNFLALQQELTTTEDRIASGRRYYNATVRELNTKVESVPSNIIAGFGKIGREDYFEEENPQVRSAPQVSFGAGGGSAGAVEAGSAQQGLPEYGTPQAQAPVTGATGGPSDRAQRIQDPPPAD
jgi:LemA protein